ncbi:long-chain acyl-CoA synthetase [Rhizobiales bacterium GAS113]|nr:long-chain acyl-CoA synthetase [Rhizobiales bacterium GAS113]
MTEVLATIEGVAGPGRIGRVAIGDVLRRSAIRFPERIAIVEGARRTSFAELDAASNRLANYFLSRGLRRGDKVATIGQNSTEYVVATFAIHKAGLVWVPINAMLGADDMRFILGHAGVSLAAIDGAILADATRREILDDLRISPIVIGGTVGSDSPDVPSIARAIEEQSPVEPEVEINERDLALIMYTSGTTARPKGAMHCHLAVIMAAMSNAVELRLERHDAVTGILPLFHCGQHTILLSFMLVGAKTALMKGFDPLAAMERVQQEKLTVFVGLPLMYAAILNHPRRAEHDLGSLRACVYAMAPMPEPLLRRLIPEICPNFILISGQTEMYPGTTMAQPDRQLERFGNYWGESCLVNETAIMDDQGVALTRGEIGEIVHRGPNAMLGYYRDPAATAATRLFGWHHTGDLGLIDENGEVLFLDRKKDMIKSGGENVSSVRIEEVLLAHPAVQNAAVIGLPHPRWGEAVCAFVKLKPDHMANEDGIIQHCRCHLGGFQIPKLVKFMDEMPMTATGKLRKAELRQSFAAHFDNIA